MNVDAHSMRERPCSASEASLTSPRSFSTTAKIKLLSDAGPLGHGEMNHR